MPSVSTVAGRVPSRGAADRVQPQQRIRPAAGGEALQPAELDDTFVTGHAQSSHWMTSMDDAAARRTAGSAAPMSAAARGSGRERLVSSSIRRSR